MSTPTPRIEERPEQLFQIGDRVRLIWPCYKGSLCEYSVIDNISWNGEQWDYHIGISRFGADALKSAPTPRTEEVWNLKGWSGKPMFELAQTLETELAAALKREKALREALEKLEFSALSHQELPMCPVCKCIPAWGELHQEDCYISKALAFCTEGKQ